MPGDCSFIQARTVWHRSQLEKLNSMGPGAQYAATGLPVRFNESNAFFVWQQAPALRANAVGCCHHKHWQAHVKFTAALCLHVTPLH
jgi:hypothetical protein